MTEGSLLVADSFRVRIGPRTGIAEVRGWSRHLDRFTRAATSAAGREPRGLGAFLEEASGRIADSGEGMPRLELRSAAGGPDGGELGLELGLRLRPLPELRDRLELRTARGVSLRHPERKGPNIDALAALNRELDAEALLVDEADRVVEGATTAILWWARGRGFRAASRRRVPSVTEALAAAAAPGAGLAPFERAAVRPADLARHEVWAVNAVHGIRVVTAIDGARTARPDPDRLARFREALDLAWEPARRP